MIEAVIQERSNNRVGGARKTHEIFHARSKIVCFLPFRVSPTPQLHRHIQYEVYEQLAITTVYCCDA